MLEKYGIKGSLPSKKVGCWRVIFGRAVTVQPSASLHGGTIWMKKLLVYKKWLYYTVDEKIVWVIICDVSGYCFNDKTAEGSRR